MESLKYLETVISKERQLLHAFMKDRQFVRDLLTKPNQYLGKIKDGEIEVIVSRASSPRYEYDAKNHTVARLEPNKEDSPPSEHTRLGYYLGSGDPISNLTIEKAASYLPQFYDQKRFSSVIIPITPNESPPPGYMLVLRLMYCFGDGNDAAYLTCGLTRLKDHGEFEVQFIDDNLPKDHSHLKAYESYKRMLRKLRDRKIIPSSILRIPFDEDTQERLIWMQLLLCAVSQGYLSLDDVKVYKEIEQTILSRRKASDDVNKRPGKPLSDAKRQKMEALQNSILHLSRHRIYSYAPQSTPAYVKRVMRGYTKKARRADSGGLTTTGEECEMDSKNGEIVKGNVSNYYEDGKVEESPDTVRVVTKGFVTKGLVSDETRNSVPHAALISGVPEGTIYRLIRQGKIHSELDRETKEILTVDIKQLKGLAKQKETRKNMRLLAIKKGKNEEAVKKWFSRNKGLSEEIFKERYSHWLNL